MIKREDLNEIINLNKKIHAEVSKLVRQDLKKLYDDNLSIIQKTYRSLEELSTVIKIPINIDNIGGFIYKSDYIFCYINTNQIRVFENFVIMHEYYHLNHSPLVQSHLVTFEEESSMRLEERKANYYASLMLLDEDSLSNSYYTIKKEKDIEFEEVLCKLIDLYKVPRKTILIRLYEIECIDFEELYDNFDKKDIEKMKLTFESLGLDKSCLEPSKAIKIYDLDKDIDVAKDNNTMPDSFIESNKMYFESIINKLQRNK